MVIRINSIKVKSFVQMNLDKQTRNNKRKKKEQIKKNK